MKYELQTIPVLEAYEAGPECALCLLEQKSEERNAIFFLGNSIMAPEMRVKLNEHGFCPRHFHLLVDGEGKLGYSLALATHLESLDARVWKLGESITRSSGRARERAVKELVAFLTAQESDCLMCDRIRTNVLNFAFTIVRLFADEPEFRTVFGESRGICVHHLQVLLPMGAEVLSGDQAGEWYAQLMALHRRSMTELAEDLEAFTWQFDYQTDRKTPARARDAVPRAVRRLAGYR